MYRRSVRSIRAASFVVSNSHLDADLQVLTHLASVLDGTTDCLAACAIGTTGTSTPTHTHPSRAWCQLRNLRARAQVAADLSKKVSLVWLAVEDAWRPGTGQRLEVFEHTPRISMHIEGTYTLTRPLRGRVRKRVKYLREHLRILRAAATRFKEDKPTDEAAHWELINNYTEYLDVAAELVKLREFTAGQRR
ncbi:hypothetical protein B0H16DRAFT_1481516 [Mycena metata]|uniref:Uncharacterized protein n=1 Tax=Mycena metata TaxID=1033252 RepID=A0AAD7GYD9_9AGAR|nr:hypothetical protein B0H16DRAFT_1481516 [Mycena metata]